MKKHNEGYVLPLVMVVLVILSAFSLSVLAPAVSNLKAQQASTALMQDRYTAISLAEKKLSDLKSEAYRIPHADLPPMDDPVEWMKSYVDLSRESVISSLQDKDIYSAAEIPTSEITAETVQVTGEGDAQVITYSIHIDIRIRKS